MGDVVAGRYKVLKKLGSGSFGEIFKCEEIGTKKEFAIKFEEINTKYPQLDNEYAVYKDVNGEDYIPCVYEFGQTKKKKFMVMDSMGLSLDIAFDNCDQKFSQKTVLMLAVQMITGLENLHKHNYIHRDIKPDNFIIGKGEKRDTIFLIDMGLAHKYRHNNGEHISYREGKSFSGTARYGSINSLRGCQVSRRDDLEALGYVLVYLLKGTLPWMNIKEDNLQIKYRLIVEKKEKHVFTDLCDGIPKEFVQYFKNVCNLGFTEAPDYHFLRGLMLSALSRLNYSFDRIYDWGIKSSPGSEVSFSEFGCSSSFLSDAKKSKQKKEKNSNEEKKHVTLSDNKHHTTKEEKKMKKKEDNEDSILIQKPESHCPKKDTPIPEGKKKTLSKQPKKYASSTAEMNIKPIDANKKGNHSKKEDKVVTKHPKKASSLKGAKQKASSLKGDKKVIDKNKTKHKASSVKGAKKTPKRAAPKQTRKPLKKRASSVKGAKKIVKKVLKNPIKEEKKSDPVRKELKKDLKPINQPKKSNKNPVHKSTQAKTPRRMSADEINIMKKKKAK